MNLTHFPLIIQHLHGGNLYAELLTVLLESVCGVKLDVLVAILGHFTTQIMKVNLLVHIKQNF